MEYMLLMLNESVKDTNRTITVQYPHPAQEVVMWAVGILIVTLNLLVFVVVPRIKTLRVSTTVGMLSLAIADFLLGISGFIDLIHNKSTGFQHLMHDPLCTISSYSLSFFATLSVVMLAYLNLDRYLSFLFPLKYQLTKKRAIVINIVLWLCVFALKLPSFIRNKNSGFYEHAFLCLPIWKEHIIYVVASISILLVIPTITLIVSSCGSFYLIHTQHKWMRQKSRSVRVHCGRRSTTDPDAQWRRDRRVFKVLATMTFGYYMAWFPYLFTMAVPEIVSGHTLHPVTDFITPWLAASNSFWNPIIYMLTLRPFRRALTQLCRNTLCGRYMFTRTGGSVDRHAAGNSDTGITETGNSDTGITETGNSDTGITETGNTDTGITDTGITDTGITDTGITDTEITNTRFTNTSVEGGATTTQEPAVEGHCTRF